MKRFPKWIKFDPKKMAARFISRQTGLPQEQRQAAQNRCQSILNDLILKGGFGPGNRHFDFYTEVCNIIRAGGVNRKARRHPVAAEVVT